MSECRLITADILNCSWVNWNKLKETCSSFLLETLRTRPSGRLEVLGTPVFEDPLLPPSVQAHGVLGPACGRGDAGVNVVTWCSWSGDPRGSQCGGWVRCGGGGGGCCTGGGEEEKAGWGAVREGQATPSKQAAQTLVCDHFQASSPSCVSLVLCT